MSSKQQNAADTKEMVRSVKASRMGYAGVL